VLATRSQFSAQSNITFQQIHQLCIGDTLCIYTALTSPKKSDFPLDVRDLRNIKTAAAVRMCSSSSSSSFFFAFAFAFFSEAPRNVLILLQLSAECGQDRTATSTK